MIAINAEKIVQLRKSGYRPDEMVLISLIGKIGEPNHTVFADHRQQYDWSWVRGLDIAIYADSTVKFEQTIQDVLACNPAFLAVWDYDRKEGAELYRLPDVETIDKPKSMWKWKTHVMTWIPHQNKIFERNECN